VSWSYLGGTGPEQSGFGEGLEIGVESGRGVRHDDGEKRKRGDISARGGEQVTPLDQDKP